MNRILALGLAGLVAAGCGEESPPSRLPTGGTDASRPETGPIDARRDAQADAESDAALDSGAGTADGGSGSCEVVETLTIVSAAESATFDPAIVARGDEATVAWVESRQALSDVFARRIPATGALGTEQRLTTDDDVESELALAPNDTGYLLAYELAGLLGSDIATISFDPSSLSVDGTNPVTSDVDADGSPFLVPATDSFGLYFQRTITTADVGRTSVSTNGTPLGLFEDTSDDRVVVAPFVVSAVASESRLFYRSTATLITSFRLGADGLAATPDDDARSIPFSGYVLGETIRTTGPGASPRALLTSATASTRPTSLLVPLDASGAAVGSPLELATTSVTSAALTAHDGVTLVVYRTTDAIGPAIHVTAFSSTGVRSFDARLAALTGAAGSIGVASLSSGTIVVVEDETVGANRELRALRVDCEL